MLLHCSRVNSKVNLVALYEFVVVVGAVKTL
jgi:hypothetical protein